MRNRGPKFPFEIKELKSRLALLDNDCLAEMILHRSQTDTVLEKSAVVAIVLRSTTDLDEAKTAINYAFYFPNPINYDDSGYGQILWEVKHALEFHFQHGRSEFALSVGQYAIEKGEAVLEFFFEDWDWQGPLLELTEWFKNLHNKNV